MKKTFRETIHNLTYNLKTLFYFELMYRILGMLIIFPLAQFLFYQSIRVSGFAYITNSLLIDYVMKPFTLISFLFLIILLSLYMMIEMIMLSMIFDYGYREVTLGLSDLIVLGSKHVFKIIKQYHVRIFFPAFFFFILVELFHVVGIAQTINIPSEIIQLINQNRWLVVGVILLVLTIFVLFIQTIFHINLYTVQNLKPKEVRKRSRTMLHKKRLEMAFEFLLLNLILNLMLYLIYALIILSIGGIVSLIKGSPYAFAFVLTIFYTLYLIIGFIATITLIPINFALMTSWYEESLHKVDIKPAYSLKKMKPFKNEKTLKWGLIVTASILFVVNLSSVIQTIQSDRTQLELLNYAEIVAHRGYSDKAPENTIPAIEQALYYGADAIELDVRETKDHIPIVVHDSSTKRTTNDTSVRLFRMMSLEEVKELDAGSWFSDDFSQTEIPTLEEAIMIIQGKVRLFLELKDQSPTLEANVITLIESYQIASDTVILSFSSDQLKRLKDMNREIQTLLLIQSFYGNQTELVQATYADHYGLAIAYYTRNESFVELAHSYGKKVYIWTANDKKTLRQIVFGDIDGIITDRPILAREIAYSKNAPELVVELLKRFFPKKEQGLN